MDQILNWNPAPIKEGRNLSSQLKDLMIRKYGLEELYDGVFLNKENLDYFKGLSDAGVADANFIIEKIELHERIEIRLKD